MAGKCHLEEISPVCLQNGSEWDRWTQRAQLSTEKAFSGVQPFMKSGAFHLSTAPPCPGPHQPCLHGLQISTDLENHSVL